MPAEIFNDGGMEDSFELETVKGGAYGPHSDVHFGGGWSEFSCQKKMLIGIVILVIIFCVLELFEITKVFGLSAETTAPFKKMITSEPDSSPAI